ncbi:CGGC domain-containing protein [Desulfovibrio sp. TomC]|uniref:CGGC domain-containing protein n=1 Tax=Desulfovibrio sp. TomC TaxID=1562888 RepID=UPI0005748947|nr:CGGC domain-containing protein [Desulfovibrio sp. TomC]KHK00815.1 hypothetical protein NY78_3823 [Desulfovibrio sp. TomC]
MTDIGILTCSNTTQDVGCSTFGCLRAASEGTGHFAGYADGVRVVGVINCAGCPGRHAHDKILRRVGALAASGVTAIHLAACMVESCPFVGKYERTIQAAYPELAVVRGTHPQPPAEFLERLQAQMIAPRKSVPQIAAEFRAAAGGE